MFFETVGFYRTLDLKLNPMDSTHFENNFKGTINCSTTRAIIYKPSLSRWLTGVINALWRKLFNNEEVIMRISHWLLHNITSQRNDIASQNDSKWKF